MSKKAMEIDDESNVDTLEAKEINSRLMPVGYDVGGEGLPYAPENWPNLGRGDGSLTITGKNIYNHGSSSYSVPPLDYPSDLLSKTGSCKAGNTICCSLEESLDSTPLAALDCNVCCTEPQFCRHCCCILCSKTVDPSHGGYSYIKCQSVVTAFFICGHVAHLECALGVYMAGTVGGSIGLDDPLILVCICILRGTEKDNVRDLLKRIESAVRKLKLGTTLEDIWKADKDAAAGNILDKKPSLSTFGSKLRDYNDEILKLDDEINDVLRSLRKSQELEYGIAEELLHAQKKNLQKLYHQLQKEYSALGYLKSETARDGLRNTLASRVDMIDWERRKLAHMKEVAKGFGIARNFFGLEVEKPSNGELL